MFIAFIASALHDLDELADGQVVRIQGGVSSLMDYFPHNLGALYTPGADFWPTVPGSYRHWAIEYGYRRLDAVSPTGEM